MEKLIELLNEFEDLTDAEECEKWCIDEYDRISEGGRRSQGTNNWICSKKFGFIKWLVDNDKIEFNNDKMMIPYNEEYKLYVVSYEHLLMLLAIQDEPIEFLCSILK